MANSNFVDYVKMFLASGNGGNGSMHLHREKYVPKGGPDGGDGGRGGHIILRGNPQYWTLIHLKYKKHIRAEEGESGSGSLRHGRNGKDIYLDVPLGTVAKDAETGEILFEITEHGEEKIIVKGGRGGLGNANFKTSTNQTPRYAQPGELGVEGWFILELKILADVGLVGFPNVGKSTFINSYAGKACAKTGNKPGVTKALSWIRINKDIELLDSPGILWPKIENQVHAYNLASLSSIKEEIVDEEISNENYKEGTLVIIERKK